MGAPMARRLLQAGHRVRVFKSLARKSTRACHRRRDYRIRRHRVRRGRRDRFCHGADTPDVEAIVAKIEPALKAGQLVIDMSTISPMAERTIAARLRSRSIDYLDAPVSGGDVGAREGTLTIMVGGDAAAFERAQPLFERLGRRVTLMGPSGAGR